MRHTTPALLLCALSLHLGACADPAREAPLIIPLDDMADSAPELEAPDLAPDLPLDPPDEAPDLPPALPALPPIHGLQELEDLNPDPRIVEVNLTATRAQAQLTAGAMTAVMTYNGIVPGPLIHARVGDRIIVHFKNDLDESTLIHWHGLRISDAMDGSPMIQSPIQPGAGFTYDFVVPDAGTFWYHTHFFQIEQLERGLYGALVVHEEQPPQFQSEHILVLDDIRLDADNQVSPFLTSGPDIGRGRVGNTLLVNGASGAQRWEIPRGAVQRWRVVLASNALSYGLRAQGGKVRVIATDGGLLPQPFDLTRVEIAPGMRYELEVEPADDAAEVRLEAMILVSDGQTVSEQPFPLARAAVIDPLPTPLDRPVYAPIPLPSTEVEAEAQDWVLAGSVVNGVVVFTINGQAAYAPTGHGGHGGHQHAILHTYTRDKPVRITIRSRVSPEHPFHIHGQFFQILARNGVPVTQEPGLRDTVLVRGDESVTILSYFENPGQWMVHCHISEHGENGMMADIVVEE